MEQRSSDALSGAGCCACACARRLMSMPRDVITADDVTDMQISARVKRSSPNYY